MSVGIATAEAEIDIMRGSMWGHKKADKADGVG